MPIRELARLAGTVFLAMGLIVLADTAGKILASRGVAPPLIAMLRFGLGAVVIFPLCRPRLGELRILFDWRILLRGAAIAGAICSILIALRTEPIANVYGAFFIGPIVSYLLSTILLGEHLSKLRTVLLATGFSGVLAVVKPSFDLSAGMMFACAAGAFYGIFLTATKAVAREFRPTLVLLSQILIGTAVLAPLGLSAGFPQLTVSVAVLFAISAFSSAAGNYLIVIANRKAEATTIAPLVYSQLISATAAGVLVFGETPDALSLFGLGLIMVSGFGSLLLRSTGKPMDLSEQ